METGEGAFKKAVVLLATDCGTKWGLFFFQITAPRSIIMAAKRGMTPCLQLLNSVSDRDFADKYSLWISSLPQVRVQDLAGFDMSGSDEKKAKAEENVKLCWNTVPTGWLMSAASVRQFLGGHVQMLPSLITMLSQRPDRMTGSIFQV